MLEERTRVSIPPDPGEPSRGSHEDKMQTDSPPLNIGSKARGEGEERQVPCSVDMELVEGIHSSLLCELHFIVLAIFF
jgi:hypothetical protein